MDRYFKYAPQSLGMHQLHIVGVTAMYMASKVEDSDPLTLEAVDQSISQRQIPLAQITALE